MLIALWCGLAADPAYAKSGKPRRNATQSVGSPNEGQLVGGKQLKSSSSLRSVGSHKFGVPELVDMLTRSAERVAKKHTGSVLTVGDLSRRGGGDVDGHRSHESGRDADVAFYLRKGKKPFVATRFTTIAEDLGAKNIPGVSFDAERNWDLVHAWITDPNAHVLQIFVADHLKKRLLEEASKSGASESVLRRAKDVLFQPTKALPHDDHFHLRIACPPRSSASSCQNFATKAPKAERAVKPTKKSKQAKKGTPKRSSRAQSTRVKDMSSSKR